MSLGFGAWGFGFRGLGFRGLGFRVWGFGGSVASMSHYKPFEVEFMRPLHPKLKTLNPKHPPPPLQESWFG